MKYFGKKSLSSLMSVILRVSWYVVLVLSIIAVVIGLAALLSKPFGNSIATEIAKDVCIDTKDKNDWEMFIRLPLFIKLFIVPYFGAIVVLLLMIIKKAQQLFVNFKNDILFNESNALIISKIAKLNIGFAFLTFNFSALLASVFLLLLCEILKKGTMLQEEHDLTV